MTSEPDDGPQQPRATVFGTDWPGRPLPVMPGDFSRYLPQGMGLDVPVVVRPWDDLAAAVARPGYYGLQARDADPVRGAPLTDPAGGVIYFDWDEPWEAVQRTLALMGVLLDLRRFVAFAGRAADPQSARYVEQIRIVRIEALRHFFRPGEDAADLPDQPVTVGACIRHFLADQLAAWQTPGHPFSPRLYGAFGGDGDFAKESLCFGAMVENGYWGVYRVWSRAWLVTK